MCNKVNLRILQNSINMCIKKSYFDRSGHLRCSVRKGFPRNFAKFTGKHLYQSLFFNKVAGLRLSFIYFPMNFAKILRTPFFTEHLR